jgi:sigma-54-specific transcriptional regulator
MSEKIPEKILIVDDNATYAASIVSLVKNLGYEAVAVDSPLQGIVEASKTAFAMVLMEAEFRSGKEDDAYDLLGFINGRLDDKRRLALEQQALEKIALDKKALEQRALERQALEKKAEDINFFRNVYTPVIILTSQNKQDLEEKCKDLGALAVLIKGNFENSELEALIGGAVKGRRAEEDKFYGSVPDPFIGGDPHFLGILAFLDKVARSDKPVLLTGETGVGKEILAKRIVDKSPRKAGVFLTCNCSGVSQTMIEDQLFGHVKNAYTGAASARKGLMMTAAGGTIFLDEIAETDQSFQAKLLRAIQFGEVQTIGMDVPLQSNVRFRAATTRDLPAEMERKTFREDLSSRVPFVVEIPPLRARAGDLPDLIAHILGDVAKDAAGGPPKIDPDAMDLLRAFSWPGNIRQLKNVLDYAIVMAEGAKSIGPAHLPGYIRHPASRAPRAGSAAAAGSNLPAPVPGLPRASAAPAAAGLPVADGWPDRVDDEGVPVTFDRLEKVEALTVLEAMVEFNGVRIKAAKGLGITTHTLRAKIDKYGLEAIFPSTKADPVKKAGLAGALGDVDAEDDLEGDD